MNRVELTGRLTRDPETSFVGQSNFPIVRLNVAVDDGAGRFNRERGKSEYDSGFYQVEVMGEYGTSVANQLSRGDEVYVLGSLSQWQPPAKDGEKQQSKTRIHAKVILALTANAYPTQQTGGDPSWSAPPVEF